MKPTFLTLSAILLTAVMSAQRVNPSSKVLEAFTPTELTGLNDQQINELNLTAKHLCWFEEVKETSSPDVYQLLDREGNPVVLSAEQLTNFNPLLYTLSRDPKRCGNHVIQTTDGSLHLLIVRSDEMMEKVFERNKVIYRNEIKNAKATK